MSNSRRAPAGEFHEVASEELDELIAEGLEGKLAADQVRALLFELEQAPSRARP